jgi:predicted aspartyl protease
VAHGALLYEAKGLSVELWVCPFGREEETKVEARIDTGSTPNLILKRGVGERWGEGVGRGDEKVYLADGGEAPVFVYNAYVWLPGRDRPERPIEIFRFRQHHKKQESLIGLKWLRDYEVCIVGAETEEEFTLRLYSRE